MSKLLISLSVNNPDEAIKQEKGKWISFASKFFSKEKRKEKVETEIALILKDELKENLQHKLQERGIDTEIKIEIIE